jgi:Winged helix-turn-helix DNA-binding
MQRMVAVTGPRRAIAFQRARAPAGTGSLAELGRRVGLSSPAVSERLARLERENVIVGHHAHENGWWAMDQTKGLG